MKRCPECSRQYTDESLIFCLEDGKVLLSASEVAAADTIEMGLGGSPTLQKAIGEQRVEGCSLETEHFQQPTKEESAVRELDSLIYALENFHSNPEGIYYIGQTLLKCESFLEKINLSAQADELITPLVEEIDNDTRKEEGLFDPIVSVGKVRKLIKFLKQTRPGLLGESTDA
jgi:hypothetical protein